MDEFEGTSTQSFAASHLIAAEHFSAEVGRLETEFEENEEYGIEHDGKKPRDQLEHEQLHKALAIYTGISCVGYLESLIHEVYHEHSLLIDEEMPPPINEHVISEESFINRLEFYNEVIDGEFYRRPTLEKYLDFLLIAGENQFDRGTSPYQEVRTLVKFRNYFTHYVTEYYELGSDPDHIEHEIGAALQGKFELNPMAKDILPVFPDHCLSYGFTEWAVSRSKIFVREFYNRLDLMPVPTPATKHVLSDSDE